MNAIQKLIALEKDAQKFGFCWPDNFVILDQIISECLEVREEISRGANSEKLQEEMGDLLQSVISLCIFSKFDVKETVDKINAKFSKRIQLLKKLTKQKGLSDLQNQSVNFKLNLWKEIKKIECAQKKENI